VYDHLTEVVLKLVSDQPDAALAVLETISAQVKGASFPAQAPAHRVGGEAAAAEAHAARGSYLSAQAALFGAPKPNEEGGATGEAVQDFTDESAFLEWAGVSFGKTGNFRLHLSLKHLAAKFPTAKNLRLFGKLLGTAHDYYVAEAVMEAPEGEEDGAKDALGNLIQKTGEGPNKFTYFVCNGVGLPWTRLPQVTPQQVSVARQVRRYLSGDLKAPVMGHPPFPGSEASYLRALIALIAAGTSVAPAGVFQAVEGDENGAIEPVAEDAAGDAPDLSSLDSWVHTGLALNVLGRTKPNPPKMNDAGEEVPDENAPEPSAPLKPISEDPPLAEGEGGGSWEIRVGPVTGLPEGEAPKGVTVLRSLRFPGAVTVGVGKKSTSLYVGYGHEVSLKAYAPALPPKLPEEFDFTAEDKRVKEKADVTVEPKVEAPEE
jgi:radial spoke head protein 4A